uniref:Chitin-binding type-2 domain-containing protein n=1 Tax=Strigamia maritima TaxID=126957 RepID=T1JMT5_STRMM
MVILKRWRMCRTRSAKVRLGEMATARGSGKPPTNQRSSPSAHQHPLAVLSMECARDGHVVRRQVKDLLSTHAASPADAPTLPTTNSETETFSPHCAVHLTWARPAAKAVLSAQQIESICKSFFGDQSALIYMTAIALQRARQNYCDRWNERESRLETKGLLVLILGSHNCLVESHFKVSMPEEDVITNYTESCASHPNGIYTRMLDNCKSYYRCYNGSKFQYQCEDGFAFDMVTGECTVAEKVQCNNEDFGRLVLDCEGKPDGVYVDFYTHCHNYYW